MKVFSAQGNGIVRLLGALLEIPPLTAIILAAFKPPPVADNDKAASDLISAVSRIVVEVGEALKVCPCPNPGGLAIHANPANVGRRLLVEPQKFKRLGQQVSLGHFVYLSDGRVMSGVTGDESTR